MSRDNSGTHGETRSSALWGTGNRGGDSRANALWGKGGRGFIAILSVLFVTAIPLAGGAVKAAEARGSDVRRSRLLAKAHTYPERLVKDDHPEHRRPLRRATRRFAFASRKDEPTDRER